MVYCIRDNSFSHLHFPNPMLKKNNDIQKTKQKQKLLLQKVFSSIKIDEDQIVDFIDYSTKISQQNYENSTKYDIRKISNNKLKLSSLKSQ